MSFSHLSKFRHLKVHTRSLPITFQMMAETTAPKAKKPRAIAEKIATHSGTFHCDEVLACYMLQLLPEYKDASIIRTRDPELLKQCDVVVDVGGLYDPSTHRYDHHQRTFNGTMHSLTNGRKPWVTKLSSAGLVYLHFGHYIISAITGLSEEDQTTDELFDCVYVNFVEEVDAVDNGISDRDGIARYKVNSTISSRVGRLNPAWNNSDEGTQERFQSAMRLVGKEFTECVLRHRDVWLPGRSIVKQAIQKRYEVHSSGEIICLECYCPWIEHLFQLEENLGIGSGIKFVLYKEKGSEKWRLQAVPIHPTSFESRLPLPESWRGLRNEELSKLSGISDCVFVHASGFIGGNQTYEGALKMAVKAATGIQ